MESPQRTTQEAMLPKEISEYIQKLVRDREMTALERSVLARMRKRLPALVKAHNRAKLSYLLQGDSR